MKKEKKFYRCSGCGAIAQTWSGRCSVCGEWNTLEEEAAPSILSAAQTGGLSSAKPSELYKIDQIKNEKQTRLLSGNSEFDRALGGEDPGIVPGSVILLAGNPGIGKSTLLLQISERIEGAIYFSAEESLGQISARVHRLGIKASSLRLSAERDTNAIIATLLQEKPPFAVIDSVQTIFDDTVPGTPGSIVQVRENCWRLQQVAKQNGIALLLVGHVTKEGVVAGPRVLEHLVDAVMYLEGDKNTGLRLLRGEKNRFGPTDEVGIWQMRSTGFVAVDDPGTLFAKLVDANVPGRALSVTTEGTRAFIVEIQALVTKTAFGYPKRTAQGFDPNRLALLLAVLENRLRLPLSGFDVYINVVGGFTLRDPGVDLAVACAILSGYFAKLLPPKLALIGEVGLLGEIRPAVNHASRVKEAKRLSYTTNQGIYSVTALAELFEVKKVSDKPKG